MAIGWLTVLTSVPWGDVISNAPKVADGAKKLWKAVGKTSPAQPASAGDAGPDTASGPQSVTALQQRIAVLENATNDLHEQMLASSELIKTLADQNAQLIQLIETNRIRVAWLTGATVLAGIIAVIGLALAWFR